jgi:two-component system OmpR family response regulator
VRSQSGLGSGLTVLRAARARGDRTPVLVLTARNRTDERIAGLNAGADDYLGKPFDLGEVEARLHALVRRSAGGDDRVAVGQLALDRAEPPLPAGGPVAGTARARIRSAVGADDAAGPRVQQARALRQAVGPGGLLPDNALEAFISRLRKKLAGSGAQIRTLRGLGYLVEPELERAQPLPLPPTLRQRLLRTCCCRWR